MASDPKLSLEEKSVERQLHNEPIDVASEGNKAVALLAATKDVEDLRQKSSHGDVNIFTYAELRLATKNFRPDQILGQGGFGTVYKGMIEESTRPGLQSTQVAVKILNPESIQEIGRAGS
ncbi:hypothetical protein HPP92_004271 [Vanilla planifolia]|uniref:Protein kinase domain-containing protein n=1 Tax=Vanilla planifolia TaxID=51239 RepID=A0A835RX09_VANPL|nr:hypothetical protein HPP92_004271 [Vanilla planifolia]